MNILHITPHMGGGVGTVIMDWISKDNDNLHKLVLLDAANEKARKWADENYIEMAVSVHETDRLCILFEHFLQGWEPDIVLVHYWDHPLLRHLFRYLYFYFPPCRMVFWSHKNISYSQAELDFPDIWVDTSPIQGHGKHIWSTGDISKFLAIKPKKHEGFNVGYAGTVGYQKIHSNIIPMCRKIQKIISEVKFTFVGDVTGTVTEGEGVGRINDPNFNFTGKVDDIAPYLAEMDCFGYPLRPDHYGTCEQVLGEAMAAGVVPVVMNNPAEKLIVRDRWSGLVARDEEDYVSCISYIFHTAYDKRIMSANARYTATHLYSLDTMISQWNEVFESMMLQPKKRRESLCI